MTSISSRMFNQDTSGAKKSALQGPVFITDRGKPAHVLLTITDYEALQSANRSLLDVLAQPESDDFEFEPGRLAGSITRAANFT